MPDKKSTAATGIVVDAGVEARKVKATEQQATAESFIKLAIEKGLPIETIEKFMTMRRELRAEVAKEAFDAAMSRFQSASPVIEKTKGGAKTKSGATAYKYAPIGTIVEAVKGLFEANGLSYGFKTAITLTHVKVVCISKHELGHQEETEIEVPMGSRTEIMSAPQMVMATMTYAKRYAFCNAFGIVTGDEDTDAADLGEAPTTRGGVAFAHPKPTTMNGTKDPVAPPTVPCTGDCGTIIESQAVIEFSKARYGKPLCADCQAKQQAV